MVQPKTPKLMWQVRSKIRAMHYSYQTEKTYVQWIKRFLHFNNLKHPTNMGEVEVNYFLTHNVNKVELPYAMERKSSNAGKNLGWQWVFPSLRISTKPLKHCLTKDL